MNFTGAVSIIFYDINKSKYIFILTLINLLALYSSTEILTFLARITPLIRLSRNFPWLSSFWKLDPCILPHNPKKIQVFYFIYSEGFT